MASRFKFNITILFLLLVTLMAGCDNKHKLEWNIKKGDFIYYTTAMKPLKFQLNKRDSTSSDFSDLKNLYETINNKAKDFNQYSILEGLTDEKIDMKLVSYSKKQSETKTGLSNVFSSAMQGVLLRGEIDKTGKIVSNYLASRQKNLIAIMFQLPSKPVCVGDEWKIDTNFLEIGNNFICNNSENRNSVRFKKLKERGDTLIAELEYDIFSSVEGELKNSFQSTNKTVSLAMGFIGIAEFDIQRGKWIMFNGIFSTERKGMVNSLTKQSIQLLEAETIPTEIKELNKKKDNTSGSNTKKENINLDSLKSANNKQDCPIIYQVQVVSSIQRLSKKSNLLKPVANRVKEVVKNKEKIKYKYVVGHECSYEDAHALKKEMIAKGFSGAFIIKEKAKQ